MSGDLGSGFLPSIPDPSGRCGCIFAVVFGLLLLMLLVFLGAGPFLQWLGLPSPPGLNAPAPGANTGGPGAGGASAAPSGGSPSAVQSSPIGSSPLASAGASAVEPTAVPSAGSGGGGRVVPPISERFFASGTVHAVVSGAIESDVNLPIDDIKSYVSNDELAWIAYGAQVGGSDEVLITFNEGGDDTVTVAQGSRWVKGVNDECRFDVKVTDALVSGNIACPAADAFDGDQPIGPASIEVEFTAAS
jgi:hypothetical protein